ncbi:helix-hairpin-helix domain-containing protein [Streptomyces sp. Ac-502]|uniref:helix-hairpin-helix domain-containing protein n=1 Tax=Streptomyces sp. Ac-502 TaxID=3342801 RepID=UPI003862813E
MNTSDSSATIEGIVEHLLFVSFDENTVLRLSSQASDGRRQDVTARGKALFSLQPGESVELTGTWEEHPRYGRQFRVQECRRTLPASVRAIRMYLASGLICGIGPALAEAIVGRFGEDTLRIIDEEPDRLAEIHGIAHTRTAIIVAAWATQKAIAALMTLLHSLGISTGLAIKIYSTYRNSKEDAAEVVRERPYQLIRDVHGIAFDTADRIALAAGVPKHDGARLQAALLHILDTEARGGHCYTPGWPCWPKPGSCWPMTTPAPARSPIRPCSGRPSRRWSPSARPSAKSCPSL